MKINLRSVYLKSYISKATFDQLEFMVGRGEEFVGARELGSWYFDVFNILYILFNGLISQIWRFPKGENIQEYLSIILHWNSNKRTLAINYISNSARYSINNYHYGRSDFPKSSIRNYKLNKRFRKRFPFNIRKIPSVLFLRISLFRNISLNQNIWTVKSIGQE